MVKSRTVRLTDFPKSSFVCKMPRHSMHSGGSLVYSSLQMDKAAVLGSNLVSLTCRYCKISWWRGEPLPEAKQKTETAARTGLYSSTMEYSFMIRLTVDPLNLGNG